MGSAERVKSSARWKTSSVALLRGSLNGGPVWFVIVVIVFFFEGYGEEMIDRIQTVIL